MKDYINTDYVDEKHLTDIDIERDISPDITVIPEEVKTDEASAISRIDSKIIEERLAPFNIKDLFYGGHIVSSWKRYKRMIAKITVISKDQVELECLIDEDNEIYRPKRLAKHLFEEVNLIEGDYLLFNYYKKRNEWKVEVLDDQRLFSEVQFPKIDFDKYENSMFLKEE